MKVRVSKITEDVIDVDIKELIDTVRNEIDDGTALDFIEEFDDNMDYYLQDRLGYDYTDIFYVDQEKLLEEFTNEVEQLLSTNE